MNLLIIGYCHLDDGFLYASKALENLGYIIYFFPYLSHIMDKIENRDEILLNLIKDKSIDICLWWCNNITIETYDKIINNSFIEKENNINLSENLDIAADEKENNINLSENLEIADEKENNINLSENLEVAADEKENNINLSENLDIAADEKENNINLSENLDIAADEKENNINLSVNILTVVKQKYIKKKIINYFFSWDPVLYDYKKYENCHDIWNPIVENKKIIYALMTHVFSCFEKEIEYFKSYQNISYAYPGFDKEISFYEYDEKYICDISIVCTNIYNNNNEFPCDATNISRYEIIDTLYKYRHKIKFHIYGTENLKNRYPDCYRGFIKYQKCNKVFSNSKINLSIHPIVNELNSENSTKEYFSERVPQILGCNGLLVTNSKLSNILIENEDYIYIDKNMDWLKKILDIIKNSDEYDNIRENGYKKGIEYYTWNNFAHKIYYITKLLSE